MAGIITPPTAAVVAGPLPEMAEKNMEDKMVTMPRPLRTWPIMASATSISRLDMPPISMMEPAKKNNGTAIKGNESTAS